MRGGRGSLCSSRGVAPFCLTAGWRPTPKRSDSLPLHLPQILASNQQGEFATACWPVAFGDLVRLIRKLLFFPMNFAGSLRDGRHRGACGGRGRQGAAQDNCGRRDQALASCNVCLSTGKREARKMAAGVQKVWISVNSLRQRRPHVKQGLPSGRMAISTISAGERL